MMNGFKQQFSTIKGLSEKRRLPRLGKVRLGVKAVSKKTGKEYPVETPHFVVDSSIARVFGEKPTELRIMLPVNDPAVVFPQRLMWWGGSKGLKCSGDGISALRIEEPDGTRYKEMISRECPCELLDNENPKLKCTRRASLMFMIPEVSMGGIYQLDLGSINSIIDINSGLDFVTALIGRFSMVPLVLKRTPRETHPEGKAKQIHYTLQLFFSGTVEHINALRENTTKLLIEGPKFKLPAPEMVNPAFDEGATVVEVIDEETGEILDGPPTEAEVREAETKAGMTPPEIKPETPLLDKTGTLASLKVELAKAKDLKSLNAWVAKNKPTVPAEIMADFAKMLNERVVELTKEKQAA